MKAYLIISHLKRNGEVFETEVYGIAYKDEESAVSEIKGKIKVFTESGGWTKVAPFEVKLNFELPFEITDTYTCEWEVQSVYVID